MLSLELIERELAQLETVGITQTKNRHAAEMILRDSCPLLSVESLNKSRLYFAETTDPLFLDPGAIEKLNAAEVSLVLIGDVAPEGLRAPFVLCRFETDIANPMATIQDALFESFGKYEAWRQNMLQVVMDEDIEGILEMSYRIFNATLSIVSASFKTLAAAGFDAEVIEGVGKPLDVELINILKDDHAGTEIHKLRKTFQSPDHFGYFDRSPICFNIFFMGGYYGRLVATPRSDIEFKDFLQSEYDLLDELGRNIEIIIKQQYATKGYLHDDESLFSSEIYSLFKRLLNRVPVEQFEIEQKLRTRGMSADEVYHVGHLVMNEVTIPARNDVFYCQYIMQQFSGIFPLCHKDNIVLLISQNIYETADDFIQAFSIFLRENNFRMGLSNPCHDLKQLYHYYQQAEIAFSYGMQRNEMIWTHKFSDYLLDYFLQPMRSMPAELLCAEELQILKEYDEKNNSDYLLTLKTYIDNQMNAVQTAKELYVHHATMVFRLKRLKELTGIDFKDTEKIVHLYLSFRILQN